MNEIEKYGNRRQKLNTEPTKRQREILDFIVSEIKEKLQPPTLREIGKMFSIASTNGVRDHLILLGKKGYVKNTFGESRGVLPTKKARDEYSLWFYEI